MEVLYNSIFDIHNTWELWVGISLLCFIFFVIFTFKSAKIDLGLIGLVFGPLFGILLLASIYLIGTSLFTTSFNLTIMFFIFALIFIKRKSYNKKERDHELLENTFDEFLLSIDKKVENINENTRLEDVKDDYINLKKSSIALRYSKEYEIPSVILSLYKKNKKLSFEIMDILYPAQYEDEYNKPNEDSFKTNLFDIFKINDSFYRLAILEEYPIDTTFSLSMISKIQHPRHRYDIYKDIVKIFYEYSDEGFDLLNMIENEGYKSEYISEHENRLSAMNNIPLYSKLILDRIKLLEEQDITISKYHIKDNLIKDLKFLNSKEIVNEYRDDYNYLALESDSMEALSILYTHIVYFNEDKTLMTSVCPNYPTPLPNYTTSSHIVRELKQKFSTWTNIYKVQNIICLMTDTQLDTFYTSSVFAQGKSPLFHFYEDKKINYIHIPIENINELTEDKLSFIKDEYNKISGNTLIHKMKDNDEIVNKVFNYLA